MPADDTAILGLQLLDYHNEHVGTCDAVLDPECWYCIPLYPLLVCRL